MEQVRGRFLVLRAAVRDHRTDCQNYHVQHLRQSWFCDSIGLDRVRQDRIKRRTAASLEGFANTIENALPALRPVVGKEETCPLLSKLQQRTIILRFGMAYGVCSKRNPTFKSSGKRPTERMWSIAYS